MNLKFSPPTSKENYSLGLFFALSSDFAVYVKTSVTPPENLLNKREAYELGVEKKAKDISASRGYLGWYAEFSSLKPT